MQIEIKQTAPDCWTIWIRFPREESELYIGRESTEQAAIDRACELKKDATNCRIVKMAEIEILGGV